MKAVFLLSVYLISMISVICIGIYYIKKLELTWGHLLGLLVLGVTPMLNTIMFIWMIATIIDDTGFFDRRVFKD